MFLERYFPLFRSNRKCCRLAKMQCVYGKLVKFYLLKLIKYTCNTDIFKNHTIFIYFFLSEKQKWTFLKAAYKIVMRKITWICLHVMKVRSYLKISIMQQNCIIVAKKDKPQHVFWTKFGKCSTVRLPNCRIDETRNQTTTNGNRYTFCPLIPQ